MNKPQKNTHNDSRYHVPGLLRGLHVIEVLDENPGGLTIERLTELTGFPKNSVFRIVMTLMHLGYVSRDEESKVLTLSRKVLTLGFGAIEQSGLMDAALDVMHDLRDEVKETVLIGTMADGMGIVLEQVLGLHPFKFMVDAGKRLPIHAAAPCKAMLAYMPAAKQDELIAQASFEGFNERTITDPERYRHELAEARRAGYALDRAEEAEGVYCIAAPIFDSHGFPKASVWVVGPSERLRGDATGQVARLVREHADRISKRLSNGINNIQ